jgi:hypothetical protein
MAWPAKIEPLGHGEEGKGNVLVDGAFRSGNESINGTELFVSLLVFSGFLLALLAFFFFLLLFLELVLAQEVALAGAGALEGF